jgi:hypothetical protein
MQNLAAEGTHAGHQSVAPGELSLSADDYVLVAERTRFTAGESQLYSFRIETLDGTIVENFEEEEGGVRMHLIVVRRDLTHFQHLHPEMKTGGMWSTYLELPVPGTYRAFADFQVAGIPHTLGVDVFAPGPVEFSDSISPVKHAEVEGYEVALGVERATAGGEVNLGFRISEGSHPVADLEPYLGALGHLVVLRSGDLAYLHAHPTGATPDRGTILFEARFPSAGRYGLFLQFRHREQVRTAAFAIDVLPAAM